MPPKSIESNLKLLNKKVKLEFFICIVCVILLSDKPGELIDNLQLSRDMFFNYWTIALKHNK